MTLLVLGLAAASNPTSASAATNEPAAAFSGNASLPALVFDVDQAWPTGITENDDLTSLDRMLTVIAEFKTRFNVFVIFSPLTAKTNNLRNVLRLAAKRQIPFLLDVYSSDAMAIGKVEIPTNPDADPSHALAISLQGLRELKADPEIGPAFAGLRFMEMLGMNFTVRLCRERATGPNRVNWCDHFARNLPKDDPFKPEIAKPLMDFAKNHGMWVLWSDWKWDDQTRESQNILKQILASGNYKNTVVLTYANNLPGEAARDNDANWRKWKAEYQPLVGKQIKGLGLSDQSWTCAVQLACPVDVLTRWARQALAAGAIALELEPANYFFYLPHAGDIAGYPDAAKWREAGGRPNDRLVLFAKSLGVELGDTEPKPGKQ